MPDATLHSFLDGGTRFEGKITFTGTIRLDGAFKGEASADGTLVIGMDAADSDGVPVTSELRVRIGGA